MSVEAICDDEASRVRALHGLQILDTPPDPRFDRIVRLAKAACDAPIALISLVDEHRQWFKAAHGMEAAQTPREDAFCAHALGSPQTLWVEDASLDERFASNRFVLGDPFIRFYAGAPIKLRSGYLVGTVCIIAPTPRPYDPKVDEILTALASLAADEMEAMAAKATIDVFVDNAPTPVVMTDPQVRIQRVSHAWSELYQRPAEAVVGRRLSDLFPGVMEPWAPVFARALEGAVERGVTQTALTALGPDRWFKWVVAPWRDAVGRIGGLLIASLDVTDLVRAQETSQRDARRLKMAIAISNLLVWEVQSGDEAVTWSGDLAAFFDRPPSAASLSDGAFDYAHSKDRAALTRAYAKHAPGAGTFRHVFRLARADPQALWVSAEMEAVLDETGAVRSTIGVLRDVTAAKHARRTLEEARETAERASAAKSDFLANMSHELRTPMNGVLGVVSALARTPLSSQQAAMVSLVERSGQALNTLLSDVLDVSRLEAGQLSLTPAAFDLDLMLDDLAGLFAPLAAEKGLALSVARPGVATWVVGDSVRLRQILSNLLTNAVKFTQAGGVGLTVERADASGELVFEVADSGIGFSAGEAERVFDRFYQADATATRRFGGAGLGLAISRTLARLMGGDLTASGAPGAGAVFRLTVTMASGSPPVEAPANPEVPALRILLAEDNPVNQQVVRLILEQVGADLTVAENGQAALEAFQASAFDLVLMDMQMPVMDGLSAVRAIRAWERQTGRPPTAIKTLSANALEEHRQAALLAGANDHLTKPITAAGLIGALADIEVPAPVTP